MDYSSAARPIAYLALLLVIPLSIVAFATMRPTRAALAIKFGSLMFLPERVNFDPPGLPPFDKQSLPALCMLVGVLVTSRDRLREAKLGRGVDLLMLLAMLGVLGTALTNQDVLKFGPRTLPSLGAGEGLSLFVSVLLGPIIPFFLARILIRTAEDAKDLFRSLVIAGLVYTPFILIELKFSPQLHNWVYGFHQHDFIQTVRGDAYRPMCFMSHGLTLATFMWASLMSAWILVKSRVAIGRRAARPVAWMLTVLFPLIRSYAAIVYALVALPLVWLTRPRAQLRFAALLSLLFVLYPITRVTEVFPAQGMVDFIADVTAQDRADSINFRFENEDILAKRAVLRPWFGWGNWGRSRIYDDEGRDISVTDGEWILIFGATGIVGSIAIFGLILVPIFSALRRLNQVPRVNQPLLAGAGLIVGFFAIDLLPNSMGGYMVMFLSGALAGLSHGMAQEKSGVDPQLIARILAAIGRSAVAPASQVGRWSAAPRARGGFSGRDRAPRV